MTAILRLFVLMVLAAGWLPAVRAADSDTFYYARGQKHPLKVSAKWVGVKLDPAASPSGVMRRMKSVPGISSKEGPTQFPAERIVIQKVATDATRRGRPAIVADLLKQRGIQRASRVYDHPSFDAPLVETGEVLVRFKPGVSREQAMDLVQKAGAVIKAPLGPSSPNGYIADVLEIDKVTAAEVANALYESGQTIFCHPNFIAPMKPNFVPDDPLYPEQWYFRNSGQGGGTPGVDLRAQQAWNITRGSSNVSVAVFDDGIDIDHEDFAGKVLIGYDYFDNDADPRPALTVNNHGTACAGIAVATGNNALGVSGMAPNCRLVPVRVSNSSSFVIDRVATAFENAADSGVDVISCSWYTGDFDILDTAIEYAATEGRNGKGCVVVFSAGNENRPVAETNPQATLPSVICVAASTDGDVKASYSSYGSWVDVTAPSSGDTLNVKTTDRTGASGYHATNYANFGGTSASCPLVAGIAALLLSSEPELTAAEVRERLQNTADKIDQTNGLYEDGRSPFYGYGRVNAARALGVGDTNNPTVTIVSPGNGSTQLSLASVSGTAGDVGTGLYEVRVGFRRATDGKWWNWATNSWGTTTFTYGTHLKPAVGTASWSLALPALGSGQFEVYATSVDNGENGSPLILHAFSVGDFGAPTVSITTPAHLAVVNALPSIGGSAADAGTGIQGNIVKFQLMFNGPAAVEHWDGTDWVGTPTQLTAALVGNQWSYTSLPSGGLLRAGEYLLSADVRDNSGNFSAPQTGINRTSFRVDYDPPDISITSPVNLSTINGLLQIRGTASDLVGQPSLYIIRYSDGAFWTAAGWASGQTAILPTTYDPGTQTWVSSGPLPQVGGTDPATAMDDGGYNIIAFAYDGPNERRADVVVTVDTTQSASVLVTTPLPFSTINGLPSIAGTASAVVERIELFVHRYDDGKWWDGSAWADSVVALPANHDPISHRWTNAGLLPNNTTDPATSLASGSYDIFALAYDAAGNPPARHDAVVTVNRTLAPAVQIVAPTHGAVLGSIAGLSGAASAVVDGVNVYLLRLSDGQFWDGTAWGGGGSAILPISFDRFSGLWSTTGPLPSPGSNEATDLTSGEYNLIAIAYDSAGGQARADSIFTVDNSGPQLVSLQFSPASIDVSSQPRSINGTLHITDGAGFSSGWVDLISPSGDRTITSYVSSYDLVSGTFTDGTFAFNLTIPRYVEPGTWSVAVTLFDEGGIVSTYGVNGAQPMPAGSTGTIAVQNSAGVDQADPVVASVVHSPATVNVTSQAQTVAVTVTVTDDLAGLEWGYFTLSSPSGADTLYGNFDASHRISGTATNGVYRFNITVPRSSEPGVWPATVFINDVSNRGSYHESAYGAPFASDLLVVNSGPVDLAAPLMSGLQINPSSVDVTSQSQQITVTFDISDDVTGFESAYFSLTSPVGQQYLSKDVTAADRIAGTGINGTYSFTLNVPRHVEPGLWKTALHIRDQAGRNRNYGGYSGDLPVNLTVVNQGAVDSAAPVLTNISFSPSTVNVTNSSQQVTVTMQFTDDLAGVAEGFVEFSQGYAAISVDFTAAQRISGDAASGTYQAILTVPQNTAPGLWTIYVGVGDAAGNWHYYGNPDYYALPLPAGSGSTLTVTTGSQPTYNDWSGQSFPAGTPPADKLPDADPDGDGVSNLLEYAFNLLPLTPSSSGLPTVELAPGTAAQGLNAPGAGLELRISYNRRIGPASGVTYSVDVSDNLLDWDTTGSQIEQVGVPVPNPDGQTERVTCRVIDSGSATQKFVRVAVTQGVAP